MGESSKVFLSIDCFIMDTGFVKSEGTTLYLKTLLAALAPIGFVFVIVLFWGIAKLIFKARLPLKKAVNNITLSLVVTLFLLHPTLTGSAT